MDTGKVERDWLKAQVFALHEDTIEKYHAIGQSAINGTQGAFARGRCVEAKSIARAIDNVCHEREVELRYAAEVQPPVGFVPETIAARIRQLRSERSLSLQQLADRSNLSKAHIWELEKGKACNPTIRAAVTIAAALGVSLDYLCGLSTTQPALHPEALRIACEVDALLRAPAPGHEDHGTRGM